VSQLIELERSFRRMATDLQVVPRPFRFLPAVPILLVLSLVPANAAAQAMKLLNANTGWFLDLGSGLHWTSDGGSTWTRITPVPPGIPAATVSVHGLFFLNPSQGWAIVSYPQQRPGPVTVQSYINPLTVYQIAKTSNAGQTWSFIPFIYPALPESWQDSFAGPGGIDFVDSLHGWIGMMYTGNARTGKLLATQDGGETWQWVNSPHVSGLFNFLSTERGWLVSDVGADTLYATDDGCKSWHEVRLTPPSDVGKAIYQRYQSTPVFRSDGKQGFLAVHYIGGEGIPSKLVIYSTNDSGRTWKSSQALSETEESWQGGSFAMDIADSSLFVQTDSSGTKVAAVPLTGATASPAETVSRDGADALSFADSANGWALETGGRLQSTHDGGKSWKDITPIQGGQQ
jgi:photosystem II stability/assembly factor-like uncharacterized protein